MAKKQISNRRAKDHASLLEPDPYKRKLSKGEEESQGVVLVESPLTRKACGQSFRSSLDPVVDKS